MSTAAQPPHESRGASLLLRHCDAFTQPDDERASAPERLEQAVGGRLAKLLLFALAGRQGRRGSSSP